MRSILFVAAIFSLALTMQAGIEALHIGAANIKAANSRSICAENGPPVRVNTSRDIETLVSLCK